MWVSTEFNMWSNIAATIVANQTHLYVRISREATAENSRCVRLGCKSVLVPSKVNIM